MREALASKLDDVMGKTVFKIASAGAWNEACRAGAFTGSEADKRDGFIHLSAAHQLAATAAKHFAGQKDLLLIAFDAGTLGDALKWEVSRGGDLFPHLYGPLPAEAALWTKLMETGDDGVPRLPQDLDQC
jgi:uncharacterized protein (DUF952 family)